MDIPERQTAPRHSLQSEPLSVPPEYRAANTGYSDDLREFLPKTAGKTCLLPLRPDRRPEKNAGSAACITLKKDLTRYGQLMMPSDQRHAPQVGASLP